ncbi:uncharacterized protein LOC143347791 isoform X2 [Colletes latitarsis]|uniref:uncharacterized protein LOC143347791 isoform X2 n=1 Tax=Colletes latitarsis TaxID=2605962 RepID=UPI0040358BE5
MFRWQLPRRRNNQRPNPTNPSVFQLNGRESGLLFVGIRTVNTHHSNHKLFEERRASERCERTIWVNTKRTRKIRRNHEHVARREAGVEPAVREKILRKRNDAGSAARKSRGPRGSSKNTMYAHRSGHDAIWIHEQHICAGPHS